MSKYVEYVPECCYTCEYVPHVREYVRIRELGGHVLNLRIRGSRIFRVLTWLSLRHFDRNEDHDNRRNEHADRKKTDRRIGRQDGACLYFTALGRRVKLRGHSEDLK